MKVLCLLAPLPVWLSHVINCFAPMDILSWFFYRSPRYPGSPWYDLGMDQSYGSGFKLTESETDVQIALTRRPDSDPAEKRLPDFSQSLIQINPNIRARIRNPRKDGLFARSPCRIYFSRVLQFQALQPSLPSPFSSVLPLTSHYPFAPPSLPSPFSSVFPLTSH